jgi:hypothetical protein
MVPHSQNRTYLGGGSVLWVDGERIFRRDWRSANRACKERGPHPLPMKGDNDPLFAGSLRFISTTRRDLEKELEIALSHA